MLSIGCYSFEFKNFTPELYIIWNDYAGFEVIPALFSLQTDFVHKTELSFFT